MKKSILGMLTALAMVHSASAATEQKLPTPDRSGGMPLMQALNERQSIKKFNKEQLDNQTLSEILWAAYGMNRSGGLRTIPTAMNQKDLDVFVAKADGIWRYDAVKHSLIEVSSDNILPLFETQDYMKDAPLVLIYAGSKNEDYPVMHAGSAYQNVGLYAASKGLSSVVRGYFDKAAVAKALNLPNTKAVIVSQAVGKSE